MPAKGQELRAALGSGKEAEPSSEGGVAGAAQEHPTAGAGVQP